MSTDTSAVEEFTVDELAARAQMTVRNVRAYASRGLIAAPRLEGRTGYYTLEHLQRLQLIRQLIDRGYTLAAVEKAIARTPKDGARHALDLMNILELPQDDGDAQVMSRDDLAALAGVPRDDKLIDSMEQFGLVEWVDGNRDVVRLLEPVVVRTGAAAVALGLAPETVIGLFPIIQSRLREIADAFVNEVSAEIVRPFVEAGLPEDEWPHLLHTIENLVPIASQITLGIFRGQFREAIDTEIGEQLTVLSKKSSRQR
ncbi:MerR family transcriptional regulator [Aeromicrobium panaciterrae]|uniref:MerR family transcriptional regulator n=1 Tax=Aeromicrobium panaciterrae TaxID=363861 RepID=UPI0031CE39DF